MKLRRVSLGRISRLAVGLTILLVVVAVVTRAAEPWSIAAGAVVMLANFHLLRMLVSLLIRPASGPKRQAWVMGLLTGKLVLGVIVVAGVLYQLPVEPLAFALGASTLLIAAVVEATWIGEPVEGGAARDPVHDR